MDILSRHLGHHIERFKAGKDGGVDGRFFTPDNNEVIIQCKHWIKSGLAKLLKSIKDTEADKVRKLSPERYLFVTSIDLSRANKTKIKEHFSPFILREDDIYGNEDINDLLSEYPDIEQKHYKLWITSTNVLRTVFNSAIIGRSKYKLEEIAEESCRYVITKSHLQAKEKLESMHSIIITGAPGVGKTMLSEQICQFYSTQNYELCFIENSLNEAEKNYDEARKQVFYFDDFLGRNFLLALNNHQDSHVINFIKRIARDSKKRFILTSRSNILNQGKRLSDLFENENIDRNEYEVSISSLSDYDKARILYNHIWFSQLEDSYVDEIYKNKRYYEIIKHKNFNPRLISFITDMHRLKGIHVENYWNYIEGMLNKPQDIWKHVFDAQLNDICKNMVIAVSIHGKAITETRLKDFFNRLVASSLFSGDIPSFDSIARLLVGALLNRTITGGNHVIYDLFNPSIADYVLLNYVDNVDYIDKLLSLLQTSQSIDNIESLFRSGQLKRDICKKLIEKQVHRFYRERAGNGITEYSLRVLALASGFIKPKNEVFDYITNVIGDILDDDDEIYPSIHLYNVILWAIDLGVVKANDRTLNALLEDWIAIGDNFDEEYEALSKIIIKSEPVGGSLTDNFKEQFFEFISDNITDDAIEADILPEIYDDEIFPIDELRDFVDEKLSEIAIDFNHLEIDKMCKCCHIDDIIQSNVKALSRDEQPYEYAKETMYGISSPREAIEDLFDRG